MKIEREEGKEKEKGMKIDGKEELRSERET